MLLDALGLIFSLVVAGIILYFVNTAPPGLDPTIKWLIRCVIIVICVVAVMYFLWAIIAGLAAGGFPRRY
jgi:hypothetical protein